MSSFELHQSALCFPDSATRPEPIAFIAGFGEFIYELVAGDPLAGYDRTKQYTVPKCTIEIIFGHYRKLPHIINTDSCSGATVHGCAAGGMTIERWFGPNIIVPPKQLTPFPGAKPLSTSYVHPNDELAQAILADFQAGLAYAQQLCRNEACSCSSVTLSIKFLGLDDSWYDSKIKEHLRKRGVTEQSQVVQCR